MSQWHKIHWKPEHAVIGGIRLKPTIGADGKVTIESSHPHHVYTHSHTGQPIGFNDLDWSAEHETNAGMHHVHNGVVDHIMLNVEHRKNVDSMSVHPQWKDKDGKVLRQDTVFQPLNTPTK